MEKGSTRHSTLYVTATETEGMQSFIVESSFALLRCDGPGIAKIGIDEHVDGENPIILEPGESLPPMFPRQCNTIYHICVVDENTPPEKRTAKIVGVGV